MYAWVCDYKVDGRGWSDKKKVGGLVGDQKKKDAREEFYRQSLNEFAINGFKGLNENKHSIFKII